MMLSMICIINANNFLIAKNPTYQDFYITNRTNAPVIISIESSYDAIKNKYLAPASSLKFTYRRNKYIKPTSITYAGGLTYMMINKKTYTTATGFNGNQYFPQALMPNNFSYNSISIYPNYISYDPANIALA